VNDQKERRSDVKEVAVADGKDRPISSGTEYTASNDHLKENHENLVT